MSRIATKIFFALAFVSKSAKDDHAAVYAAHLVEILEAEGLQVERRPGRLGVRAH